MPVNSCSAYPLPVLSISNTPFIPSGTGVLAFPFPNKSCCQHLLANTNLHNVIIPFKTVKHVRAWFCKSLALLWLEWIFPEMNRIGLEAYCSCAINWRNLKFSITILLFFLTIPFEMGFKMSILLFGYVFNVQPAIRSAPSLGISIWAIL